MVHSADICVTQVLFSSPGTYCAFAYGINVRSTSIKCAQGGQRDVMREQDFVSAMLRNYLDLTVGNTCMYSTCEARTTWASLLRPLVP
jgi:hypothetical protein